MKGIDTSIAVNYTSKYDNDEPKTTWKLGILSAHAYAYISSKIADSSKSIEGLIEVVRFGLLGFDNFKDAKGNAVPFETEEMKIGMHSYQIVKDRIVSMMPVDLIIELGGKILEASKLTEQEIKN